MQRRYRRWTDSSRRVDFRWRIVQVSSQADHERRINNERLPMCFSLVAPVWIQEATRKSQSAVGLCVPPKARPLHGTGSGLNLLISETAKFYTTKRHKKQTHSNFLASKNPILESWQEQISNIGCWLMRTGSLSPTNVPFEVLRGAVVINYAPPSSR